MKKLVIDCDNTFGVDGCDLDDGLAILYALGTGKRQVLAVTTTFGNSDLEVVYPNTIAFMKEIGMEEIPVLPGHEDDPKQNRAARRLVELATRYPKEVDLLATGSLTNLHHAWLLDGAFFEKLGDLSLMGGITQPLLIRGKRLDELNFSCNSAAAFSVLSRGGKIRIATGNHCLDALFPRDEFNRLERSPLPLLRWLHGRGRYWFDREKEAFGHDGIYKWDVYAAAALLCPELFDENQMEIAPDPQSLKTGMLLGGGEGRKASLPLLKDSQAYRQHVYQAYARFAGR